MAYIPLPPPRLHATPTSNANSTSPTSISRRNFLVRTAPAVLLFNLPPARAQSDVAINDLKLGDGDTFKTGDLLKLHYTLTLGSFQEDGGKVIDSSRSRGRPFR